MNPETAKEDVLTLEPGAAVVYDEPLKLNALRDDLVVLPGAVRQDRRPRSARTPSCGASCKNMIYDGVLSQLLDIDLAEMEKALRQPAREEAQGDRAEHGGARGRASTTPSEHLRQAAIRTGSSR